MQCSVPDHASSTSISFRLLIIHTERISTFSLSSFWCECARALARAFTNVLELVYILHITRSIFSSVTTIVIIIQSINIYLNFWGNVFFSSSSLSIEQYFSNGFVYAIGILLTEQCLVCFCISLRTKSSNNNGMSTTAVAMTTTQPLCFGWCH